MSLCEKCAADCRHAIEPGEVIVECGAYEPSNDFTRIGQYDGLKQKYIVIKADTGELVKNCFVLRPDRDPAAVAALQAYAEATDNESLASDIISWVGADKNYQIG